MKKCPDWLKAMIAFCTIYASGCMVYDLWTFRADAWHIAGLSLETLNLLAATYFWALVWLDSIELYGSKRVGRLVVVREEESWAVTWRTRPIRQLLRYCSQS